MQGCEHIVGASVAHRTIHGDKLFELRITMGVSQAAFADRCGHSQQFQQRIERSGDHEVLTSRAEAVCAAILYFAKQRGTCGAQERV